MFTKSLSFDHNFSFFLLVPDYNIIDYGNKPHPQGYFRAFSTHIHPIVMPGTTRYHVRTALGDGRTGTVFRSDDLVARLDRPFSCQFSSFRTQVAIKIITDASFFPTALNEINITNRLSHPCVLGIIDSSVDAIFLYLTANSFRISSGGVALVMDLAEAGDLFGLAGNSSISDALIDKYLYDMVRHSS